MLLRCIAASLVLVTLGAIAPAPAPEIPAPPQTIPAVRFSYVDLYLDSGERPLGAYQLDLTATAGQVEFVGIEGGEPAAFREPPYYDPHGMTLGRLILAAYSVNHDLPHGKTRIARIHVQITGDANPAYAATLTVAADAAGQMIQNATLSLSEAPVEGVAP